jgi:HNH endonuclease
VYVKGGPDARGHSLLECTFDAKMRPMRRYNKPCTFGDCHGKAKAHGLCQSHLDQQAKGQVLRPIKRRRPTCTFKGCRKKHYAHGLCRGHNDQRRKGQELRPLGQWGRGRWVDPKGYVWVKAPKGHPNARGKSGWIMEHVLVMSTLLGRPLRQGEQVHHKNLIKSDNRPENLELWNTNQPTGARVSDMLAWCRWYIGLYQDAPEFIIRPEDGLIEDGAEMEAG